MFDAARTNAIMGSLSKAPVPLLAAILDAMQSGGDDEFVVSPTLDTSAYAPGEVLFDLTEIPNAVQVNGGIAYIKGVTIIDTANQGPAFNLLVSAGSVSLGSRNAAPSITPANTLANKMRGLRSIGAGDYLTINGAKVACLHDFTLQMKAGAATRSLYLGGILSAGTPTFAANSLTILLSVFSK